MATPEQPHVIVPDDPARRAAVDAVWADVRERYPVSSSIADLPSPDEYAHAVMDAVLRQGWRPPSAVSVSPVETDGLRERIAEALTTALKPGSGADRHGEHIRDGACYLCRGDVDKLTDALVPVFEQAHGDLVARAANLRSERDRLARDVDRLTSEMLMVPRANDSVIAMVVEAVLAAGDWNSGIDAARRVFRERAALASSPATDPEPATPDVLWRDRDGAIWREGENDTVQLFEHNGERPTYRCPWSPRPKVEKLWGPLTRYEPVAPQAPAEPTEEEGRADAVDPDAFGAAGYLLRPPAAGPAVPEDTATPDDADPVADVLAARDAVLNAQARWHADNPGLIPPDDYNDDLGGWDSHRADTTRPAGEER